MSVNRESPDSTWTKTGKLFSEMTDSEVEYEARRWLSESRFYNRATLEFGSELPRLYGLNDLHRYRNYIAAKTDWDRKYAKRKL